MDDANVYFVKTVDDQAEFLRWMGQSRPWLAVDTETTGLRWWDGRVRLAQIGDRTTAWCFDWQWWAGAVRQGLSQYEGPIVFHNANFDLHFLDTMGLPLPAWNQVHDTQVMTSLLDGGAPSGLKPAAARRVDSRVQRGEAMLKDAFAQHGWGWDTVPVDFPPYWGYGGLDTILTARLAENEYPEIQAGFKDLYELERAVGMVLFNMEKRGAHIDLAYVRRKQAELQQEKEALTSFCKQTYDFGPSSPASVRAKLLELGANLTKKTDTGDLATTSVVLKEQMMVGDSKITEVAEAVLRYRKVAKTLSSYMNKFLELADSDGHLHPNIRQMGARTGRMSVATPNLQALTRGPEVRDAFIPSSEDNRLLLIDYDQIEMRLLYHFCRDPQLYTAIMSGDLHTTTARMAYADPTITKDDPRRQPAKSAGFAKIYGAGIETFAATAGIPLDEARHFMELYNEAFPGVDPFMGKVQAIARNRLRDEGAAWVKTPAGRRQVADPSKIYTAVNYLIQGTAADVLKQTIVRLDAAGLGEFMVVPVHDEVVFDVPLDQLEEVRRIAGEIMPVPAEQYGVPLTVGEDVVYRWGDKYSKRGETHDDPVELADLGVEL
jgi:DNA polymerase-1